MPNYRLLIFHASRLDRWEEFEAESHLDAVLHAARQSTDEAMELWSAEVKIAIFRPRPNSQVISNTRRHRREPTAKKA